MFSTSDRWSEKDISHKVLGRRPKIANAFDVNTLILHDLVHKHLDPKTMILAI